MFLRIEVNEDDELFAFFLFGTKQLCLSKKFANILTKTLYYVI